jgi:hypothetical protein
MVQGSGEPDQGVRGGAPALDPERAVAVFADPHLVTGLQAEPVPEVGRDNESSPVVKSGIPTVGSHVGEASTHPSVVKWAIWQLAANREHWFQLDALGLLQQLGLTVVPGPRLLPRILAHQLHKLRGKL